MFVRLVISVLVLITLVSCGQVATPTAQAPQAAAPTTAPAAPKTDTGKLVVYSGRNEQLIGPLIEKYKKATGMDVQIRYGDTAQLAATILEEGNNSPADVYFAQDAGALGALSNRGRLIRLPDAVLNKVEARFRSPKGEWVGISGRARVVVYNSKEVKESDLPDSILGFTDAKWKGKLGWAPTNGSFQAFVTAMRVTQGEDATKKWLQGIQANNPKAYSGNTQVLDAVAKGEISIGFINHYYLLQVYKGDITNTPVRNYSPRSGDIGGMVNIAGVGILNTAKNKAGAEKFIEYLLNQESQQYFSESTYEYPLINGAPANKNLTPLDKIKTPALDLSSLADLDTTLKLLRDLGILS